MTDAYLSAQDVASQDWASFRHGKESGYVARSGSDSSLSLGNQSLLANAFTLNLDQTATALHLPEQAAGTWIQIRAAMLFTLAKRL